MQKWAFFTMGVMTGVIILLVYALMLQGRANEAYAAQGADGGRDLLMATGGAQRDINDIVWVLHEHDPIPGLKIAADDDEAKNYRKSKRLSLLMYKIDNAGGRFKLVSARDIAYDEELMDYNTDKPPVKEVFDDLKKVIKNK